MSSSTINFSSTSLPDITGATTPPTFSGTTTPGPGYSIAAVLTESDTTVTAFQVPGTTGLLIVDGTTLTWRHEGITLSDGDVISAGFNGLEDQTTTAQLGPIKVTGTPASSSGIYTIETINPSSSSGATGLTTLKGTHKTATGGGGGGSTASSTGASGASKTSSGPSSSSSGVAPTLGAGKTVALLGALGGMLAYGL